MSDLATVQDLIQQNETAAQSLTGEVEQAIKQIVQLEEFAATLSVNFTASHQKYAARSQQFRSFLETLEHSLTEEIAQSHSNFDGLQQQVEELASQVEAIAETTTQQLREINTQAEETLTQLEAEAESLKNQLKELAQAFQEDESEVEDFGEEVKKNIDHYQQKVEDAKAEIQDKQDSLTEQFKSLESTIQESLQSLMDDFEALKDEGKTQQADVETTADEVLKQTDETLKDRMGDSMIDDMSQAMDAIGESLSEITEIANSLGELTDGPIGEILDTAGDITEAIEPILKVLEIAQEALS